MLTRLDLRGSHPSTAELRRLLPRGGTDIDSVTPTVAPIVDAVRARGAAAALEYGARFDGCTPPSAPSVRVPRDVVDAAVDTLDPAVVAALRDAVGRVRAFHSAQVPTDTRVEVAPGGVVTERWIPVRRVGLYVPGGQAVYPSSVVMNAVPAQEAGVEQLVVASPPQADNDGWPHPTVLAACSILGVDEVWAVGGAQAVALLAHGGAPGEEELEPVDMVTGPGNVYVTAAKRLCRGTVGIDAEAGPTEIAVLADATADPVAVAYDLISQAEHDVMAASVLITDSEELADAVDREVAARHGRTLNADRVREALTGPQSGIVLVDDTDAAVRVADAYAAEHLEVQTADARAVAARVTNAGAVFVGPYSPVPLGDYAAGSNHVLPTSGSARHSSGLSTHTFLRSVHVVDYDRDALAAVADTVTTLAAAERLPAHGEAVRARFAGTGEGDR
ncbi:histidinol dehydrogenase [Corynebacterium bovis]|uniref:Histidinol dehydrogenase n=1 Tax=Corynebacterium bovis DSM 20582 = CIP 54.80 TaxID=927655 RepID=A0A8H9Y7Y0_9CORY|nr:histidinol dehydrogenase [Corynebacterium bovis]MBB3115086.1 histidinol dehydrogenase [Corynebacterium bovis DSM 20582 = CIP 54.80]QQC47942.1 histidinol dehydrogenase [Corynebacterium bovis]RRO82285.1 histidinol dehydrogenase [Corynebacterium bovis]RRO84235.1 histidinol dehydrogenase [Corynebacterium bovis]RRO85084.1 histidinol dehydrogenase [Corynebacterium bovis]